MERLDNKSLHAWLETEYTVISTALDYSLAVAPSTPTPFVEMLIMSQVYIMREVFAHLALTLSSSSLCLPLHVFTSNTCYRKNKFNEMY